VRGALVSQTQLLTHYLFRAVHARALHMAVARHVMHVRFTPSVCLPRMAVARHAHARALHTVGVPASYSGRLLLLTQENRTSRRIVFFFRGCCLVSHLFDHGNFPNINFWDKLREGPNSPPPSNFQPISVNCEVFVRGLRSAS
jgi:hypothetical protein